MSKYLLVSVSYENLKRGAYTVSERMCKEHPQFLDHIETKDIKGIDHLKKLNGQYLKLIFITQVLSNYSIPLNIITLRKLNYLLYSRENAKYLNVCNNGFYYSKSRKIKKYIPLITDFKVNKKEQKIPCLGFYVRNYLNPDSYHLFLNMLNGIKQQVNVYTMGEHSKNLTIYKNVNNHYHTYDNKTFFENVTHYIYPRSKIYEDPLPHSVIEAIQNNIQIISPTVIGRDHKDGIDDILEITNHHQDFNDVYFDNKDTVFKSSYFCLVIV